MEAYRDGLYKSSDGFVLTFSITDEDSFAQMDFLRERICINCPDAALILVGWCYISVKLVVKFGVRAETGGETEAVTQFEVIQLVM